MSVFVGAGGYWCHLLWGVMRRCCWCCGCVFGGVLIHVDVHVLALDRRALPHTITVLSLEIAVNTNDQSVFPFSKRPHLHSFSFDLVLTTISTPKW